MEILITIAYIVACVLLFALAILVHEFGHFIVALKLGLRVEAFSIGFGPALWKKTVNGVEYRLSAIPLGGYVSIPDVDPEGTKALEGTSAKGKGNGQTGGAPVREDTDGTVSEKIPAWKELLVAVAGPAMNVVLAVVLACVLALVPGAKFGETLLDIASVLPDTPAATVDIRSGDRIVSVNGNAVRNKSDLHVELLLAKGRASEIGLLREGTNLVVQVEPNYVEVRPTVEMPILGVVLTDSADATTVAWMPNRNPLRQLAWDAGSIVRVLKGLVSPKEAKTTAANVGGPVMIAESIYQSMRKSPWDGLGFLRFLNVNLAMLNLLPIPVLDGGLILFALIALVFRRRVPECVVKYTSLFFMGLLMLLMAVLILRDGWRSYKIHSYKPEVPAEAQVEEAHE